MIVDVVLVRVTAFDRLFKRGAFMPYDLSKYLVIGISSRALFDLSFENEIYEKEGLEAYCKYQIEHEDEVLKPGAGFPLVQAL